MFLRSHVFSVGHVFTSKPSMPKSSEYSRVVWKRVATRIWPFPMVSALTLVWAVFGDEDSRPVALMLTSIFAGVSALIFAMVSAEIKVAWHGLRVRLTGTLHFTGGEYGGPLMVLVGICFVGAALAAVWMSASAGPSAGLGHGRRKGGPLLYLIIGVGCIVFGIVKPFLPSGLEMNEEAVWARKGIIRHRIPWTQLADVVVRGHGKVPWIGLVLAEGPTFYLKPVHVGSNPHYVAELILYYLRHPDQRELLRDPEAAIREVMEIEGPGEL